MEERREYRQDICLYHELTDSVIKDLKEALKSLADGQMQMRETLVKLTEAFKLMERLDRRIDSVEQRVKESEEEVSDLKVAVYKAGAIVGALMVIIQIGLKVFLGI